ncbi:MAG: hypothetical protein AB1742_13440 [bacterium]
MNAREFYNRINKSEKDIIAEFINFLDGNEIDYCVIGGIGINAYCEPLITLDFDCVVFMESASDTVKILRKNKTFKVKKHPHTIEIRSEYSDLKIHVQSDKRYQPFLKRAKYRNVLGYNLKVAAKEDILRGKIREYSDPERNELKREKDLLDIKRLIAKYPRLKKLIPETPARAR